MVLSLIDADSIYFRAAYVTKKKNEIRKVINETMREIEGQVMAQAFEEVQTMVAVKGKGNFRKDYFPFYKGNRKDLDEEMKEALNYGHSYMCDHYGAVRADGMEADDLVAIWAHEAREAEEQYVVVGIDKDLLQIPGNHYNFKKKQHEFIDDDIANYKLMVQCLTGDSTDNIPGIRGIGPKKAEGILQGIPLARRWDRVRAAHRLHNSDKLRVSFRLLKMITSWEEFDGIGTECEALIGKQNVLPKQEQDS